MKKNYLKKILTITAALTMSVGFVGCGNEGADNIEAGSALSTEETAGEEDETAEETEEVTAI